MNSHGVLKRLLPICTMLLVGLIGMPGSVLGADVDVYAEGAYSETDFVLYIYADITPDILSYGVKVSFDTSELTLTSAEKNEDVWFLGDGSTNYAYMEPEHQHCGRGHHHRRKTRHRSPHGRGDREQSAAWKSVF